MIPTPCHEHRGQTGVPPAHLVDGPYRAVLHLLRRDGTCDADSLEALLGTLDVAHPNHVGGVFARLRNADLIEIAGYRRSTRPERRGGIQAIWKPTRQFRALEASGRLPEAGEAA